ncbi:MAG TPA: protein translocase subunit SecD [Ignavibacteria bacterium]|nr:protein translocase subunit SecD [Ignavibacteria bacterium]HRF67029.1 protein translocase subunit SecD [Ignavibacteria bacterium]HRJ04039.1 protein translocase subunit SecD [Ignavibacteria bacterium]
MRKNRFRIILTLLFIGLSLYFLYPTYKDYQFNKDIKNLANAQDSAAFFDKYGADLLKAREDRIKLGLDLQGGMYVIMEVDIAKLLLDLAKKQDETLKQVLDAVSEQSKTSDDDFVDLFELKLKEKGLSLKAYYGEIRDEDASIKSTLKTEVENAIDRAIQVVRNRIDQYGVSEPVIQKKGSSRLVVELPGVSNIAEVRKLLQGTALLEFKLVIDPQIAVKVMEKVNTYMAGGNLDSLIKADSLSQITKVDTTKQDTSKITDTKIKKDSTSLTQKDTTKKDITKKDTSKKKNDSIKPTDANLTGLTDSNGNPIDTNQQMSEEEFKKKNPWFYLVRPQQFQDGSLVWLVRETDKPKVLKLLEKKEIQDIIPADISFAFSNRSTFVDEGENIYQFYVLKKAPELTGGVVINARSNIDPTNNTPVVYMEMNSDGSADWARITGANINKQIAIVLDNVVYSAPVVRSKITGGSSQIEGMANIQEAKLLEIVLKAGALPAPLSIIEERTVGPSLGEDSIQKGLYSSIIALILVAIFMIVYYRFAGSVADLALVFNMFVILGIMASFHATLTLPGIAGLILSIGMAVDSNVLIYERIREELAGGKPIKTAIEIGYKKAFSAIFDGHVTSIITAIILYQFGTGPIQGFALTLLIGLIANLFTAIVMTRIVFDVMTDKGKSTINFG